MNDTITLRRAQIREVDRIAIEEFDIPGIVLMENAGRGLADHLCGMGIDGPVVILCGPGNNGGDGYVLARHLDLRDTQVCCVVGTPEEKLSGDAKRNYEIARRLNLRLLRLTEQKEVQRALSSADWIVDGLLGTGASGSPREPMAGLIQRANNTLARRMAIDIPSGLDCDTGEAPGAVFRAHHTATLAANKIGFSRGSAKEYVGRVVVLDIGIPRRVVELARSTER